MSPLLLLVFICAVLTVSVGAFVLAHASDQRVRHAFFVFTFGTSLWITSYGLTIVNETNLFLDFLNLGGLLLVLGLVRFAQVFPRVSTLPVSPYVFWPILIIGGLGLVFSGEIIHYVEFFSDGSHSVHHGSLMGIWTALLSVYILVSFWLFGSSYTKATGIDRERLRTVCIGICGFVLSAIIFDAILPGLFNFDDLNYLGPLSAVIVVCATAYAILRHNFLDIRVVIQRSLIYSLSFFVLAVIYLALLLSLQHIGAQITGIAAPVSAGITILIGMYTLPRMETYFRKITDPLFFSNRYDYFELLEQLSDVLNTHLNLRPLVLQSLELLTSTLKPSFSYFDHKASGERFSLGRDSDLLDDAGAPALRISVSSETHAIGEYVLGPKRSGARYTPEDLALLRTFGKQATVAFEKAELYHELRDYSEHLEEKVDERTLYLTQMQEQQRELFDDISHALQTPLTVIRNGVEIIKNAPFPRNDLYAVMEKNIDNVSQLVRSILVLARIDRIPLRISEESVSLTDVVHQVCEYVGVIADGNGSSLETTITPNLFVRGDRQQLEEAVTNILSNALKYTSQCPLQLITVRLYTAGASAILEVQDSGIGMSPEQLAAAFDRFYRASNEADRIEGHGLGLAITKRIVERHKGLIEIRSELGSGTTVVITLPLLLEETTLH